MFIKEKIIQRLLDQSHITLDEAYVLRGNKNFNGITYISKPTEYKHQETKTQLPTFLDTNTTKTT
jgi:hypothetical protein